MLVLRNLHWKYADLKREFALESGMNIDEMSSLLQDSMDTFDGEIPVRI